MSFDKVFNGVMNVTEKLFCRSKIIAAADVPKQPFYIRMIAPLCWEATGQRVEIPYVQLIIGIIVTVASLYPAIVGGEYVVYVINCLVILLSSFYLAIRFSYVPKEKATISTCDIMVIQLVVYVLFVDYMYNDFIKTFYNKILKPNLFPTPKIS